MGVEDPQFSDIGQITAVFDQRVDTTNVALFGELEYQFARYWRFIMGARYDIEESDSYSVNEYKVNIPSLQDLLPEPTWEQISSRLTAFLPKIGLVYDISPEASLGFTYQQGYRAGGVQTNYFNGQRNIYDPEYTNNYEIA